MSEGDTTRISAHEALRRIERGESLTDWDRVRAMSDGQVEAAAAADPDWQEVDPDWVATAERIRPARKRRLTLALDEEIIDWFRSHDLTTAPGSTPCSATTCNGTAPDGRVRDG